MMLVRFALGRKEARKLTGPKIDGARAKLKAAIWADTVLDGYKGPAVRAHAPLFHGLNCSRRNEATLVKSRIA